MRSPSARKAPTHHPGRQPRQPSRPSELENGADVLAPMFALSVATKFANPADVWRTEIISLSIYQRRRCRKGSRHDNDATSNAVATDRQTDRVSLSRAFCCGNLALQHKHVGSSAGMSTHMTEAAREDNLGVAEAKRVFTPMWSAWPEVSSLQIVAAEQQLLESFGHPSSGAKTRATWGRDRGKSSATVTPKNEK